MTTVDTLGRAVALYRRTAGSRSAMVLLVANLIPLVGVLFFDWSLMTILVLYWVENGIVGFWNVPKIAMARGSMIPQLPDLPADAAFAATGNARRAAELQERWRLAQAAQQAMLEQPEAIEPAVQTPGDSAPWVAGQLDAAQQGPRSEPTQQPGLAGATPPGRTIILGPQATARLMAVPRIGLSIFFLVHYGLFWVGHGLFVFLFLPTIAGSFGPSGPDLDCFEPQIPMPGFPTDPGFGPDCASPMGEILWGSVVIGAIALFISHGASFLFNYLGRREYLTQSPAQQMATPYGRVIVLHLTIIFGGMVVAFLGAPIGALLVLVALKTLFDLRLHLREHRTAEERLAPVLPAPA